MPTHPVLPRRLAFAGLTGVAAALLCLLPAGPASADRFSIGFGYSSGGYRHGYGNYLAVSYGKGFGRGYRRPYSGFYRPYYRPYRYGGFGCVTPYRRSYASSFYYGGSNLGVGLRYSSYTPLYRPTTAYVVEAPRVVTERTVVVREPAGVEVVEATDRTSSRAQPAPPANRASPFPDSQTSQQSAVALDALALGEFQTAREAYAKAMALAPDVPSYKVGFGLAAALQGDLRTARFAFERAVRQGGASDFDTFFVEGAAREDLQALVGSMDERQTHRVVLAGLKKLAAANPLPTAAYQSTDKTTPADEL